MSDARRACTPDCTRGRNAGDNEACGQGTASDFAAALAMIAALPLSDEEKAEAVRRLLAERELMK